MAATSAVTTGARWRSWAFANMGTLLAHFGSLSFFLGPLLAAYAPRRLLLTYFNLFLRRRARRLLNAVDPYITVDISECPAATRYYSRTTPDTTYDEVKAYLSATCSSEARELHAEGAEEGDGLVISMRDGQDVADEFGGVTMWWSSVAAEQQTSQLQHGHGGVGQQRTERRCLRLTFHMRHRRLVVDEYLPHVRREGREVLFSSRRRRLYTNSKMSEYTSYSDEKAWSYVDFDHPTTFETLAMEPAKKKAIMDDLDAFRKSREFYRRTGKPWKRGYLLHGPPGTGKSTMIAAMANYLDYDIYDVELTVVGNNNNLRKLLIETTSKSIIVIEDIDCSLDITGDRAARPPSYRDHDRRSSNVTLSGLLNFIDGLWSACGGERIVVFTTNHLDKLDPALIRRGRMDMHIEMSYCGFEAFKTLAKNYLDIDAHHLFDAVEEFLRDVNLTPADVAECLMTAKRSGSDDTSCLEICIDELKKRAEERAKEEAEAKARQEAEAKAMAEFEEKEKEKALAKAKAVTTTTAAARNVVRWRCWTFASLSALLSNLGSVWFLVAPLLAAYAPRRLLLTYFNLVLRRRVRRLLAAVDPYVTVDIPDPGAADAHQQYYNRSRLGGRRAGDNTYEEVKAYLSAACSSEARELRAEAAAEGRGLIVSMRDGQDVADEFCGATMWWSLVDEEQQGNTQRSQRLTFHQRHRRLVVDEYLPHVRRRGRELLFHNRRRRLYTNNKSLRYNSIYHKPWSYINFDHPTTFETLAMEPAKKKAIMDDLDAFRRNREFYRRAGKPWKRGYLLYGPPGTGKSTMIAAMANYLDYDIYDVELTMVEDNNDLRKLLIETTSKSIVVIEDIDCSLNLTGDRATRRPGERRGGGSMVTLSGLLNFIDGLWSASGGERIVVFTTNHVNKLDPALIRRGRMDMHIEMSYCRAAAFRTLAKNYLDVDAHHLFDAVDDILNQEDITPADVAECLMAAKRSSSSSESDVTSCLEFLVDELNKRAMENAKAAAEAKARAEAEADAKAMADDDFEEDDDDDYSDYSDDDDDDD
uniref:AAA+ ATPase domain-containing protein n=1 Tax=Oryza punctata TaxID=4537 RepID=A0A0E0LI43_ORYPU